MNKMGITSWIVIQVMVRIDLLGFKEVTMFEGEREREWDREEDMMDIKRKPRIKEE